MQNPPSGQRQNDADQIAYPARYPKSPLQESKRQVVALIFYNNLMNLKGMPMTNNTRKSNSATSRRPDCVTEVRMGNTVLTVSGYFKQDTTDTAADKMMRVLKAENAAVHKTGA